MLLNELFNSPLEYYHDGDGVYEFKTKNQKTIELEISGTATSEVLMHDLNGEAMCEYIKSKDPKTFEKLTPQKVIDLIDNRPFSDPDAGAEVAFDKDGDYGIAGDDDEPFQIFATILKIMEEHLGDSHHYFIHFTAKEPSRRKLYSRMIKVLAKKHQFRHVFEPKQGKFFVFHDGFLSDFKDHFNRGI